MCDLRSEHGAWSRVFLVPQKAPSCRLIWLVFLLQTIGITQKTSSVCVSTVCLLRAGSPLGTCLCQPPARMSAAVWMALRRARRWDRAAGGVGASGVRVGLVCSDHLHGAGPVRSRAFRGAPCPGPWSAAC